MKRNIIMLVCLALMIAGVMMAINLYSKLDAAEKSNAGLLKEKQGLLAKVADLNKKLIDRNKVLETTTLEEKIKTSDSPNSDEIQKYKTEAVDFIKQTDSSAYQKAVQLEKDGFNAIIENKFDVALLKFNEIVAISPSFHSAYEISRMLANNKAKFTDAATQKYLKEQVATKYKWKAPAEKINIIKAQLSNTPAVSTVKPQVTPVTNFTNIKKDTPHNTIKPVYVKPVFVKPQSSTHKLYNHIGGK